MIGAASSLEACLVCGATPVQWVAVELVNIYRNTGRLPRRCLTDQLARQAAQPGGEYDRTAHWAATSAPHFNLAQFQ